MNQHTPPKLLPKPTPPTPRKSYVGTILLFLAGIAIGAGLVWTFTNPGTESEDLIYENPTIDEESDVLTTNGPNGASAEPAAIPSQDIVVPDQEAGGHVTIQSATFEAPGWVVIHELSREDTLGNALGAARFDAGTHSGVVQLLRVTEAGNDYAAVLYRDNGDRRFDLDLDNPVRDEDQNVVSTQFSII